MDIDQDTKREIIMEHYSHPKNKLRTTDPDYIKVNTSNSSCIDNLDLYIKIKDDKITDLVFDGEACAISISSTSIMITNLIGKTVDEALKYIDNFKNMLEEQDYDKELLNEAIVYEDIYKQSNRKNCAYLPYRGIKEALDDYLKKRG